ncbi:hypothetical protein GG496_001704 [Candidatus Fervidibacteria bacterium JGI MDM2 JNZ-1-D12]
MKRRCFLSQVGTLAIFSLGSLSVVEAMQLPEVSPKNRKPLNPPRYMGEVTRKEKECTIGTIDCKQGGLCDSGTIVCNVGEC